MCSYTLQVKVLWEKCQRLQKNTIRPSRLLMRPVGCLHDAQAMKNMRPPPVTPLFVFRPLTVCVCLSVCIHKRLWIFIFPCLRPWFCCLCISHRAVSQHPPTNGLLCNGYSLLCLTANLPKRRGDGGIKGGLKIKEREWEKGRQAVREKEKE